MNELIAQQDEVIASYYIATYGSYAVTNARTCNVCLLPSFHYIVQVVLNSHHFSGFSVHERKEGLMQLLT